MPTSTSTRVPLAITFAVQAASVAAIAAIVVSQLSSSNALVQEQMQRIHTRLTQATQVRALAQVSPAAVQQPVLVQEARSATGTVPARPADASVTLALAVTR